MTDRVESPLRSSQALLIGARFLARLPQFMRRRFTLDEAYVIQAAQLQQREARFLDFLDKAVFRSRGSALFRLLDHAGMSHADVKALVEQRGLEETLHVLFRNGVYITVDEFKGRQPLVRGSLHLDVGPWAFRNPLAAFHVAARSGGSRSAAAPFLIDLAYVRACSVAFALYLDGHGGANWRKATWESPGAGSRFRLLKFCAFGSSPAAWFTQVDPKRGLDPVFRWSDRALRWGGLLGGVRIPRPILATPEDPLPVVRWARRVLDENEVPHVLSFSSSIVRLAMAASEADIDLKGARATCTGEPTTPARMDTIRSCGLTARPRYGSIEAGPIGYACLNPAAVDDVHIVRDLHAIIQVGSLGPAVGMPETALLITALHHAAPFSMLNFSMGDQANLNDRQCGCPLERLGWRPHLWNIRSFEKLTAGGVTFDDADVTRLLEEILPQQFGGKPTHYQLVEEESAQGQPVLVLRVHPQVGTVSDAEIVDVFLSTLCRGRPHHRVMEKRLRSSVEIKVQRVAPLTTRSSKILHLHAHPNANKTS